MSVFDEKSLKSNKRCAWNPYVMTENWYSFLPIGSLFTNLDMNSTVRFISFSWLLEVSTINVVSACPGLQSAKVLNHDLVYCCINTKFFFISNAFMNVSSINYTIRTRWFFYLNYVVFYAFIPLMADSKSQIVSPTHINLVANHN